MGTVSPRVNLVLLCEDSRYGASLRRLTSMDPDKAQLRMVQTAAASSIHVAGSECGYPAVACEAVDKLEVAEAGCFRGYRRTCGGDTASQAILQ